MVEHALLDAVVSIPVLYMYHNIIIIIIIIHFNTLLHTPTEHYQWCC
jgi:hypothetical protein